MRKPHRVKLVPPRVLTFLVALALVWPLASVAQVGLSRTDGARMRDKVISIYQLGVTATRQRRVTRVSERELNSYLAYEAGADIPVGLAEPRLTLMMGRRVAGRAIVDLDVVRKARGTDSWLDPVNYLTGRVPVTAEGTLTTRDGLAWFNLESATFASMPVPKTILQEVVSYYSRTPENPRGLSLDEPFPLPARIRQIEVRRGEADVIQ